jgi:hypothetical protein
MEDLTVGYNFERGSLKTIPAKFDLNSLIGEDLNVRRTSSDDKSSHGLWPGELKPSQKTPNI